LAAALTADRPLRIDQAIHADLRLLDVVHATHRAGIVHCSAVNGTRVVIVSHAGTGTHHRGLHLATVDLSTRVV
jgi:hypothetical protein